MMATESGERAVTTGATTLKRRAFDAPPPGAGLTTATEAPPPKAVRMGATVAWIWFWDENEVGSGRPLQVTVEVGTNPDPVRDSWNAAPPAGTLAGPSWVNTGTGFWI